jgi:predicted DNA-binding transcriptional regulator AlpA
MIEKLQDSLAYPPRTFRADRAAAYLSMATSTFLKLVEEGILPRGIKVHRMMMWDRLELDAALERLKTEETERKRNTVDMVLGLEGND